MTLLLAVELPVVLLWIALAGLEILTPDQFIRWRASIIERRRGRFGSASVASAFDKLIQTKEGAEPEGTSAARQRVRWFGLVNLVLALFAAVVVLAIARA